MRSLFDGTAKSFAGTYRKALQLRERLMDLEGEERCPDSWTFDEPAGALEMSLGDALDTWSVGETREQEFTYHPFEWPSEVEEPQGVKDGEEEAVDDDEDEFDD